MSAPAPTGMPATSGIMQTLAALKAQRELANLAMMIALEAPARFSKYGYTTAVNRATVARIRAVLDTVGVDWKTKHKQLRSKAK